MPSSDYLRDALANHMRGTPYTPPATYHVSLHTADPTPAGLVATEMNGVGYARQPIDGATELSAPADAVPAGRYISNLVVITFSLAGDDWGMAGWTALWDAPTGGNMIASGAFAQAYPISSGDVARYSVGTLVWRFL